MRFDLALIDVRLLQWIFNWVPSPSWGCCKSCCTVYNMNFRVLQLSNWLALYWGPHCASSGYFGHCACQTGATTASAPVSSSATTTLPKLSSQHTARISTTWILPALPATLAHPTRRPAGCVETMSQTPLRLSPVEFLGMNCVICALLIMSRGVAWRCFLPDRMRRLSTQHNLPELPSCSRAGGRLIANDNKLPMRIKLCHESSFHCCCCCSHLLTVC